MACSNWVSPDTTPSDSRIHASQAACVIDYLQTGKRFKPSEWAGHHPRAGSDTVDNDNIVAEACALLKYDDVSMLPLEVQMWWRDHQILDRARLKEEAAAKARETDKAQQKVKDAQAKLAALAKLSSSERALLGVGLSAEDKRLVKGLGPKKSPAKKVSK